MVNFLIVAATGIAVASTAWSQETANTTPEFAIGKDEYMLSCAACHGEAADGNGELATMFRSPVPDLKSITKRNDGVFPLLEVIHAIDGRAVIKGHGNPMPVFGGRFRAEAENENAMLGAEAITRGRVLELALYLQSIQE